MESMDTSVGVVVSDGNDHPVSHRYGRGSDRLVWSAKVNLPSTATERDTYRRPIDHLVSPLFGH